MRTPSFRIIPAVVLLLVVAACNTKVSIGLGTDQYGDCLVGEQAEGRMMVMCLSSPFAERPDAERKITARKVAEYVRDHEEKYKGARDVTVSFLGKKDVTDADLKRTPAYTFTHAELGKPRQTSASAHVDSAAVADTASAAG